MTFAIRTAVEADAAAITEVLNPIIEDGSHTIMDEPISVGGQALYLRNFPKRGVFNVAVRQDTETIVGLQSVEPFSSAARALAHVGDISTFVSLDARRRGIGRRLSEATIAAAREVGFTKLIACVRADNPHAVAFYENQGFRIIGTARKHAIVAGRYIDQVFAERLID